MGVLEIVLLIVGGALAILSFAIPVMGEEVSQETKEFAREEIRTMVDKELDTVEQHVDGVVDESVSYALEKTERSLERLTNEKIMAVNEYSDTVLQEIHKNHEEVMFLYDMLNDKHNNLKDIVAAVNMTVKKAEETQRGIAEVAQKVEVSRQEVESTRKGIEQTRQEAEQTRQGIVKVWKGIEQTRQEAEQTRQEAEQTRQGIEKVWQGLEQTRQGIEQTQREVDESKREVEEIRQRVEGSGKEAEKVADSIRRIKAEVDEAASKKTAVAEAPVEDRRTEQAEESILPVEAEEVSFRELKPEAVFPADIFAEAEAGLPKVIPAPQEEAAREVPVQEIPAGEKPVAKAEEQAHSMNLNFMTSGQSSGGNRNEQILQMHRQGKSKIAIAKELGLGVGEVKLVIDLYQKL